MFKYYLKEIYYNLKNKFGIFTINLGSIYISTILLAASIIIYYITYEIEKDVKNKFVINVFLQDSVGIDIINKNLEILKNDNRIKKIKYISKEDALKKFREETGEDFTRVLLDINPLPASFEIILKDEFIYNDAISSIREKLYNLKGVEDIKYESELVSQTVQKLKSLNLYLFYVSISFILIAFFILFSNAKMLIMHKTEELEILKLLGAKLSTIRRQFIYYYIFIGFCASIFILITVIGIYFLLQKILGNIEFYFFAYWDKLVLVISLPILLSWFISFIVTRSIDLKIKKFT
ncbi:MAG TPA: permease-like cell division protein FtsX [Ignavibacteriales bacterium]|nr:permease-like cell division protein FtsX [Ignavibacteriales bacterium]HOM64255.1 permease-like cell division protein FtsX [Ignavibacteriales bacterium]HPD68564.1 permease-like cell division protein FtsX [Ignavibacteriales bacterium]HPP33099.1 permease-like cell division protein FtsX [Ignavibacteriales bacterium]HRR18259.1 permease-like cell division protein FtsX [Ignavibacteriales bacterium]